MNPKEERELAELVSDAEITFNQVFMSVPFMGKYSPHQSNVHNLAEVRNQALLLAIPALHRTLASRVNIEARDIALTTFAVHWIDDCFDARQPMGHTASVWQALYENRYEPSTDIIRRLDSGLHPPGECPLGEIFEIICRCSKDVEGRTNRAIKRIMYGALIQHAANAGVRNELVRDLRAFVKERLEDPSLISAVDGLSPGEIWLTCKSVVELLHACENDPPSLDVSEICNFFFAPLVGYSDKKQEMAAEGAEDLWSLLSGATSPVSGLVNGFSSLYASILKGDPRRKRRIEQMLAVYRYYSTRGLPADRELPADVDIRYTQIADELEKAVNVI